MSTKTKSRDGGDRSALKTSDSRDDTALDQESSHKPEIDLQSWLALSKSAKPPRDRRQKRSWKRGTV